jgi:hypothetical protein
MSRDKDESDAVTPNTSDEQRQEAGEREQGVRTEKSEVLSSPQFTEDADAAD